MVEVVAGILCNILCHPALTPAVAAHPALPQAIVAAALSECHDSVALTATCTFLDEACTCEVSFRSPTSLLCMELDFLVPATIDPIQIPITGATICDTPRN